MKFNLTLTTMWAAVTVLGLFSRHVSPEVFIYMFMTAIVVTVIKR